MLSEDMPVLQQLIDAGVLWQTAAISVNVKLTQINATMPDGSMVVIYWSDEHSQWNVDTNL